MQRLQAFKYELMPNGEQQRVMRRFAGSCRFVFNKALELQQTQYAEGKKKLSYAQLCKQLTVWRKSEATHWLSETHSQPLQQSLKDLERAYKNFFAKRANLPHFKKKGQSESFRYPQGCKLDQPNSRLYLPKLGWMRYRNSREALGTVKNVTVSFSQGKWFASIQTEREVEAPLHPSTSILGINMGIRRFATFDRPLPEFEDRDYLGLLNSLKRHEFALRKAQKVMSRKTKFSNNWKKEKAKVQQIHVRIGHARRDYLHKATTTISKNHAMVCIEDVQVRNMSKSASATTEAPGNKIRAKSGLNKSIFEQGWYEFCRQLDYKLAWNGGQLIAVTPQNTSRTCPCCGHIARENRVSQSRFECVECDFKGDADVVGAISVLRAGHARLACAETSPAFGASGQEPTEVTQAVGTA